ncbi:MAG: winged helix-turn-helix domain-containing protein [Bacteroidota bacterium]
MEPSSFRLGDWTIHPMLNRIAPNRGGDPVSLEPQLMKLLLYLVHHRGTLVTKEQLLEAVWEDVIVGDNVLTRAISSLRKALGDHPQEPKYIETISKTGYRLIAEVRPISEEKENKDSNGILKSPGVLFASLALLVLFGAFSTWKVWSPDKETAVLHPVAIANNDFTEYYPAISTDGNFVAFAAKTEGSGNWEIYAKRIGTENLIPLTQHPAVDLRPVWSPNGAYVYYMRYEQGAKDIFKVSMTGGQEVRVLSPGEFCSGNFDIAPGSDEIAYNNRKDRGTPLQIELIDLKSNERRTITDPPSNFNGDIHPTYSPDGSKLAFIRERNPVSMYLHVIELGTGVESQITTEHMSINGFDWSEDGESLIYGTDRTGIYKLWRVDLVNKESKMLPVSDYQMVMPRVGSNGQMIYAKLQDNVNIWSFSMASREAKPWRSTKELDLNPTFSPNGKKVAFTTNRSGSFQLWNSEPDGNDARIITDFKGQYLNAPRWSPDGKMLVFQGYSEGSSKLYTVDSAGGIPETISGITGESHTPVFGPDGIDIYYSSDVSGSWEIWRSSIHGGTPEKVTSQGGYAPQIHPESPDRLFYVKKDQPGIWSLNLQSKEEQLEIRPFLPKKFGAFSVAAHGIYFYNEATRTIDLMNFDNRETTTLIQPKRISPIGTTIHYSDAAKVLLYAQVDQIDADIMRLERR